KKHNDPSFLPLLLFPIGKLLLKVKTHRYSRINVTITIVSRRVVITRGYPFYDNLHYTFHNSSSFSQKKKRKKPLVKQALYRNHYNARISLMKSPSLAKVLLIVSNFRILQRFLS